MLMENKRRFVDYEPDEEQYLNGERKKDSKVKAICDKPLTGIKSAFLQFLLCGLSKWFTHRLDPFIPDVVKESTSKYQEDQDMLKMFIREYFEVLDASVLDKTTWSTSSTIHRLYSSFCKLNLGRNCDIKCPSSLGKKLISTYFTKMGICKARQGESYYNIRIIQ